MLTVVCAGIVAHTGPAYSKPQQKSAAVTKKISGKPASKTLSTRRDAKQVTTRNNDPIARVRVMRASSLRNDDSGALRTFSPISQFSAKPTFGNSVLIAEARKYLGTNPTAMSRRWCARFMNMVLSKAGYAGTNSDAARSFVGYGRRVSEPRIGAIAVLSRGKNRNLGHVGIVTGIDPHGNPIVLSGNHGRRVGEGTYSRNRVLAYVVPAEMPMLASRSTSGAMSDAERQGVASPIDELLAAINSEKPRDRRETTPPQPIAAAPPAPPVPSRTIEQTAQQAPAPAIYAQAQAPQRTASQPNVTRTRQDIDPAVAKFLGIRIPDQQPQPATQRRREASALPR
ncbi:MAG: TIGR02594 family protein [Pseudolabrys sp.]|nr:TIGR02594 family protein [Pseudolabrys sp.]